MNCPITYLILDEFGICWVFDPDYEEQSHAHDLYVVQWGVAVRRPFSWLVLRRSASLRLDGKFFLEKYDFCSRRFDCNCYLYDIEKIEYKIFWLKSLEQNR